METTITKTTTPVIYDEYGYVDEDATFAAALATCIRERAEWGDWWTRFESETYAGGVQALRMIGEGLTLTVEADPTDMQCINWRITPIDDPDNLLGCGTATHSYDSCADDDRADADLMAERWVNGELAESWRNCVEALRNDLIDDYMYPDYDI